MKTITNALLTGLFIVLIFTGCAQQSSINKTPSKSLSSATENEPRFTYHEFDMIYLFYQTNDIATYKNLLPPHFKMPEDPLVMVFVADYYDMDDATEPYREAAVLLLVDYNNAPAWYCVTMPVTSNEARLGGIYYLGYPKIMGDISLQRNGEQFKGQLKLKGKTILTMTHDTKDHIITQEEKNMFERLKGIPHLNILNGEVFKVKFGTNSGHHSVLQLAKMFPDKLEVRVGKSDLIIDANAAAEYSNRLGKIFSIRPTKIMLASYLKNKTTMRFEN